MADIFDTIPGQDSSKKDIFDSLQDEQEGFWKSSFRTAYQPISGALQATTYPLDIMHMMALGEALDPEEIDRLRQISEREGIPFDEEKYMQDLQNVSATFPTQGNIERAIEERTGIPLEAKTKLQKGLKLGFTAGKMTPGTLAQKGTAGVIAPSTSAVLQEAGLPEGLSDIAGLGVGGYAGGKAPAIDIGKAKKPSGLTTRRYEKLTEPKKISESRINKINEGVETEFRDIAEDILAKSPIGETHSGLKNDVTFKQAAREGFEKVEALSEQIPTKILTKNVKKALIDRIAKKKGTGFLPSEYEKSHNKFIREFLSETAGGKVSAYDLVKQFRKNNEAYSKINEPGQSYAYNQAKRDALRDYNIAIEDVIKNKFPDSEFSKIFEDVNKNWSKIMDAETIDKFMNDLFDGKIQFKTGRDFFEKNGMTRPFKRALGEEGFKNFETLMKDLMSTEKANSMLKVAKAKGFGELAEIGLGYVIHPTLGKAKIAYGITKGAFKQGMEMLLDKPQLAIRWDRGVKAFKKGDFKTAEKEFQFLEKEKAKQEALGKFNEHLSKEETPFKKLKKS